MSRTSGDFEYDVAISYAGEDRHVVDPIASRLRLLKFSVFYDEYEQAALWGEDLQVKLHVLYSKRAKYWLMFVSEAYAKKAWPSHERRAAQERAFNEKGAPYILPIRLDASSIPGLPETIGYIDIKLGADRICELPASKLTDGAIAMAGPAPVIAGNVISSTASAPSEESRAIPNRAGLVRKVWAVLNSAHGYLAWAVVALVLLICFALFSRTSDGQSRLERSPNPPPSTPLIGPRSSAEVHLSLAALEIDRSAIRCEVVNFADGKTVNVLLPFRARARASELRLGPANG